MYCQLRPPDAMPLLTENVLGAPRQQPKFQWFHLHSLFGATLFGANQHHLPPPLWQSLVGFRLPCATPDNEAECKI